MPTPAELGWAAGIVDGEGCILLYEAHTDTGDAWVLRLIVANTSLLMLQRLRDILGLGNITPRKTRHRPQWVYEVSAKKAEVVLNVLTPYLVNKQQEARVRLYSRTLIQQHGKNKGNPNTEELSWLKQQLSDLKRTP